MYCTLIKKVNFTKTEELNSVSYNKNTNFLSVCGTNGFLQVVNLDIARSKVQQEIITTFSINQQMTQSQSQSLNYHKSRVHLMSWNDMYNKLATCDDSNTVVVWKNTGQWDIEMINNRDKSNVTDMKWSRQGHHICFIYEDGHAILGTVEGNRAWGTDIAKALDYWEWSPDGNNILFACKEGNINVVSLNGQLVCNIFLPWVSKSKIVTIDWWCNWLSDNDFVTLNKHWLLSFENGVNWFYDNEKDHEPRQCKSNLNIVIKSQWNTNGDIIAILGNWINDNKIGISFYNTEDELIRVLKLPERPYDFSWDANSRKLVIAGRCSWYFAIVKNDFKWGYCINTLIYSFLSFDLHSTVIFWNLKTNQRITKYVKKLSNWIAFGNYCCIMSQVSKDEYLWILSHREGSPWLNKIIKIEPKYFAMNHTHFVCSDGNYIYMLEFIQKKNKESQNIILKGRDIPMIDVEKDNTKEYIFHVDELPNMIDYLYNSDTFYKTRTTENVLTVWALSTDHLYIARSTGKIVRYTCKKLEENFNILFNSSHLIKIGVSPKSMYMWCIEDKSNILTIWNISDIASKSPKISSYEYRDIWDLIWSDQDELSFACYEKQKIHFINRDNYEDSIGFNGYFVEYTESTLTLVKLEDWMYKPWETNYDVNEILFKFETNNLKKFKMSIQEKHMSNNQLTKQLGDNPDKEMLEKLKQHCLETMDFETAKKTMLQSSDYDGLEFIKKLENITDENERKAEIAKYTNDYEKAAEIYKQTNQQDKIIEMCAKLGQWDKVVNIWDQRKHDGIGGNSGNNNGIEVIKDENIKTAYNKYGEQMFDNKDYSKAEEVFLRTSNLNGLSRIYFNTEQYEKARDCIDKFEKGDDFLLKMGEQFETLGMGKEASMCYLRYGDTKQAFESWIRLNHWEEAVDLAEKYDWIEIGDLINKVGGDLIKHNRKLDMITLFRKTHRHTDSAKMLNEICDDWSRLNTSPFILKKICVLSALELETYKYRLINSQHSSSKQTVNIDNPNCIIEPLLTTDKNMVLNRSLNNPWKPAEAFHFYMLCQRQLYNKQYLLACKTSRRWCLYEKELGTWRVYQWIALASWLNNSFSFLSKAWCVLENLSELTPIMQRKFKEFSKFIFIDEDPVNVTENFIPCSTKNCGKDISEYSIDCIHCGTHFSPCVWTGQSIFTKEYFKCKRCKHKTLISEVMKTSIKHCPLCHVSWNSKKKTQKPVLKDSKIHSKNMAIEENKEESVI